jgi:hypothetical protein
VEQETGGETSCGWDNQNPCSSAGTLNRNRSLNKVRRDELYEEMVADRNQTACNGDSYGQNKVFLVSGEAKPLEYASGIKLDALPLFYELCSFHLRLNRMVCGSATSLPQSVQDAEIDDTSKDRVGAIF